MNAQVSNLTPMFIYIADEPPGSWTHLYLGASILGCEPIDGVLGVLSSNQINYCYFCPPDGINTYKSHLVYKG